MEQTNKSSSWTVLLGIMSGVFILATVFLALSLVRSNQQLTESEGRFKKTEDRLEQQRAYLVFEDRFFATIRPADDAFRDAQAILDLPDFINALNDARQKYDKAEDDYGNLEVPVVLPANVKDLADSAKDNMSEAAATRSEAVAALIKAWQAGDQQTFQSSFNEAQQKTDEADKSVSQAVSNLKEARSELGLPPMTQQTILDKKESSTKLQLMRQRK